MNTQKQCDFLNILIVIAFVGLLVS